ncbi:hypothetical protein N7495_010018 [Penicillium taxi]|uniref:uncharacterized protein n=1 Tax=Penicillium taxi TaxID=168475 RepID=UPI0025453B14|nr:uncharacterized protein N7495_010018 [Penicillium taxi]KAJ5885508.1 hypothetical protein N7495_010018 [Penicillium taxi]
MTCEACRTIPPVISEGYIPKGKYEIIGGLNSYITGSEHAKAGVVDIYDIFGWSNQTLQGADLLAARLNAVVVVPDFFKGDTLAPEVIPPDTEEKKKSMSDFFANQANVPRNIGVLLETVQHLKTRFPSVAKWGGVGLCWGGKVLILASGANTPFVATGQVHPGAMDATDAEKLAVPHIVLASKDEPADAVAAYADIIAKGKGGIVETYPDMWHGWMGARSNLEQESSRVEYTRGYEQLGNFFEKYLS